MGHLNICTLFTVKLPAVLEIGLHYNLLPLDVVASLKQVDSLENYAKLILALPVPNRVGLLNRQQIFSQTHVFAQHYLT